MLTVIRYHHGEWSKEGLEVVWQLCSASIARVHCNEGSTRSYQLDLTALKQKYLGLEEGEYTLLEELAKCVTIYTV